MWFGVVCVVCLVWLVCLVCLFVCLFVCWFGLFVFLFFCLSVLLVFFRCDCLFLFFSFLHPACGLLGRRRQKGQHVDGISKEDDK